MRIIVGTSTKLYEYDNNTRGWKDVSKIGEQYHANETAPWSFALFGDYIIAVNNNDTPQILALQTADRFDDLGGIPACWTCSYLGRFCLFDEINRQA